jgi:hypothetical protein
LCDDWCIHHNRIGNRYGAYVFWILSWSLSTLYWYTITRVGTAVLLLCLLLRATKICGSRTMTLLQLVQYWFAIPTVLMLLAIGFRVIYWGFYHI